MPVIVFNKRTGKYLRRHSGSFRERWYRLGRKKSIEQDIIETFGPNISRFEYPKGYDKRQLKINMFLKDKMCDAPPEEARVYHSKSTALQSVGIWKRNDEKHKTSFGKYVLPDYMEIHEIKESFVCIMRPDGSSNCDDENTK